MTKYLLPGDWFRYDRMAVAASLTEAKAFVQEHMPDLIPLIRGLVAEGLLSGWRDVRNCKLLHQEITK